MEYAEQLPDACPPSDATEDALENVYRLAPGAPATAEHFSSYAAQGKPCPKTLRDLCSWYSCSLTTDPGALKKLSKLKHRVALKLSIPAGSGVSRQKRIHIDFWSGAGFDPLSCIVGTENV